MAKRDLNEEALQKSNLDVECNDELQGVVTPTYIQAIKDHRKNVKNKENVDKEREEATEKDLDSKEEIKRNEGSKAMHLEESLFEDAEEVEEVEDPRAEDDDLYTLVHNELFGDVNYHSKLGLGDNFYDADTQHVVDSKIIDRFRYNLEIPDSREFVCVKAIGDTEEERKESLKRAKALAKELKKLYSNMEYRTAGGHKYGFIVYNKVDADTDSYETRLQLDKLTDVELKKLKNKVKKLDWDFIDDENMFEYAIKRAERHGGKYEKLTPTEVDYIFAHKDMFYPKNEGLKESKELKEAKWQVIISQDLANKFRDAIDDDLGFEVKESIKDIYDEVLRKLPSVVDEEEIEEYKEEVDDVDEDDVDEIDYLLDNLYDFCDNLGVFIPLRESKKECTNKEELKESYGDGRNALEDLIDRARLAIDDGDDLDEAVDSAIDNGLIYDEDIINLAEYYGVIDTRDLIEKFYEELYADIYTAIEDYKPTKNLPSQVTIAFEEIDRRIDDWDDEDEVEGVIGDYLSDEEDFLVNGFNYEIKRDEDGDIKEVLVSDIDWDIDESCKAKKGNKSLKEEEEDFEVDDDFCDYVEETKDEIITEDVTCEVKVDTKDNDSEEVVVDDETNKVDIEVDDDFVCDDDFC